MSLYPGQDKRTLGAQPLRPGLPKGAPPIPSILPVPKAGTEDRMAGAVQPTAPPRAGGMGAAFQAAAQKMAATPGGGVPQVPGAMQKLPAGIQVPAGPQAPMDPMKAAAGAYAAKPGGGMPGGTPQGLGLPAGQPGAGMQGPAAAPGGIGSPAPAQPWAPFQTPVTPAPVKPGPVTAYDRPVEQPVPGTPGGTDAQWRDFWGQLVAQNPEMANAAANQQKYGEQPYPDWMENWLKEQVLSGKWGPGDAWVDQQMDAVQLAAAKQAAADKLKLAGAMGAAGLGGSGMAAGGLGLVDSAKGQAIIEAQADLSAKQAQMSLQDKMSQVSAAVELAKQKNDINAQKELSQQLMDMQKQESLLNMAMNAPEQLVAFIKEAGFSGPQAQAFLQDLMAAASAGDANAMMAAFAKIGQSPYGHPSYGHMKYSELTDVDKKALWEQYNQRISEIGGDAPWTFQQWLEGMGYDMSNYQPASATGTA